MNDVTAQDRVRVSICITRPVFLVMLTVLMWATAGDGFPLWLKVGVTVAVVAAIVWDVRGALRSAHALRDRRDPVGRPPTC